MKKGKTLSNLTSTTIGIYSFGALLFIGYAGYHFGLWLKGLI